MNRQIRRLGVALLVCYLAVFVQINRIQVFDKDRLDNDPYNGRQAQREYNRPRGLILSADGAVLARSEDIPEGEDIFYKKRRVYPERELFGHITGYFSFNYGFTGVEKSYNDDLSGNSLAVRVNSLQDILVSGNENVGNVTLTVRKDLQEVARNALRDPSGAEREGSVVLLNLQTGGLEAFWSWPSFDPTLISSPNRAEMEQAYAIYNLAPQKPMLAHQYQERYFPGSTFKLVTASTGLQTGKVKPTDTFESVNSYQPPQTNRPIFNFGGGFCGGNFFQIVANSCNAAFARMGQETIGAVDMVKGAEAFGFNQSLADVIDLPGPAQSSFPTDVVSTPNPPKLAQSSIGQNDVAATPLEMALVAAGIANGGTIPKPHVLEEVRTSEGRVASSARFEPWLTPISPETAQIMRDAMLEVVRSGSGTGLQIPGYEVGGKTGTAQLGDGRVHTWIVGFAGAPGAPRYAFAVVVLNQPEKNEFTGGQVSAPIARQLLQAALATPT